MNAAHQQLSCDTMELAASGMQLHAPKQRSVLVIIMLFLTVVLLAFTVDTSGQVSSHRIHHIVHAWRATTAGLATPQDIRTARNGSQPAVIIQLNVSNSQMQAFSGPSAALTAAPADTRAQPSTAPAAAATVNGTVQAAPQQPVPAADAAGDAPYAAWSNATRYSALGPARWPKTPWGKDCSNPAGLSPGQQAMCKLPQIWKDCRQGIYIDLVSCALLQ
jgi:hypothetical protein